MLMPLWKRLVLVSASAGAGFALMLSLIFGGYVWHQSRPKPWNKEAIKTTFDKIGVEGVNNALVFYYTMENATDSDYRIMYASSVITMGKLKAPESLSYDRDYLDIDFPIFIPAGQRVRFAIHVPFSYVPKQSPAGYLQKPKNEQKRDPSGEELATYVNEEMGNLDGFVLFDNVNRYQIDFPKGW